MYKNITNIQPILFEDKDNDQLTTVQQMKRHGGGGGFVYIKGNNECNVFHFFLRGWEYLTGLQIILTLYSVDWS